MDLMIVTLVEMLKKYMYVLCRDLSTKDITIIEVALHRKDIDTELSCLTMCGKLRRI